MDWHSSFHNDNIPSSVMSKIEIQVTKANQQSHDNTKEANIKLIQDVDALKNQLQSIQSERDSLIEDVSRLNSNIDLLQGKVKTQAQECSHQRKLIETLERDIHSKVNELNQLYSETKNNSKKDCEKLNTHIQSFNEPQRKDMEQFEKREKELQAILQEKDAHILAMANEMKRLEQKSEAMRLSMDSLKIKFENEKSELLKDQQRVLPDESEHDSMVSNRRYIDLKNKLLEEQRKLTLVEQELEITKKDLKQVTLESQDREQLCIKIQKETDKLLKDHANADHQLKSGSNELSNLKYVNEKLQQLKQEHEQELVNYLHQLEEALEERAKLATKLKQFEKTSEESSRSIEQAKVINEQKMEAVKQQCEENIKIYERRLSSQDADIRSLKKAIETHETTIHDLEKELKDVKKNKNEIIETLRKEKVEQDAKLRIAKIQLDRAVLNRNLPSHLQLLHGELKQLKDMHSKLKLESIQCMEQFASVLTNSTLTSIASDPKEQSVDDETPHQSSLRISTPTSPVVHSSVVLDEAMIMNYESEIQQYKQMVDSLRSEAESLRSQIRDANTNWSNMARDHQLDLKQKDYQISELATAVEEMKNEIQEKEKLSKHQADSFVITTREYQEKLAAVQVDFEAQKHQLITKHEVMLQELAKSLNEEHSQALHSLEQKSSTLENKIKSLMNDLSNNESTISQLQDMIEVLTEEKKSLSIELSEQMATKIKDVRETYEEQIQKLRAELEQHLASSQEVILKLNSELETLANQNREQNERLKMDADDQLMAIIKQKEELEKQMELNTKSYHDTLNRLKKEYDDRSSRITEECNEKILENVASYKEQLASLQDEISNLHKDYDVLSNTKTLATSSLQDQINEITSEMNLKIQEKTEELKDKENYITDLKCQIDVLAKRSHEMESEHQKRVDSIMNDIRQKDSIISNQLVTIASVEESISDHKESIERLTNEYESKSNSMNTEIQSLSEENSGLKTQIKELQLEQKNLEKTLNEQSIRLQNTINELNDLQSAHDTLNTSKSEYESRINELEATKQVMRDELSTLSKVIEEKEQVILRAQTDSKQKIEGFKEKLQRLKDIRSKLETENQTLSHENDEISETMASFKIEMEELRRSKDEMINMLTLENKRCQEFLDEVTARLEISTSEHATKLDKLIQKHEEEICAIKSKHDQEMEKVLKQLSDAKSTAEQKSAIIEQITLKFEQDLKDQTRDLNDQLDKKNVEHNQSIIDIRSEAKREYEDLNTKYLLLKTETKQTIQAQNNQIIELEARVDNQQSHMKKKEKESTKLIEEKKAHIKDLLEQLSHKEEVVNDLKYKFSHVNENSDAQTQLLQETITSLKEENLSYQSRLAEAQRDSNAALSKVGDYEEEVDKLKNEINSLQDSVDKIAQLQRTINEQKKLLRKQDNLIKKGALIKDVSQDKFEDFEQTIRELEKKSNGFKQRVQALECYIMKTERSAFGNDVESMEQPSEEEMSSYIDKLICRRDQHMLTSRLEHENLGKNFDAAQQRIKELQREMDKMKKMLQNTDNVANQVLLLQRENEKLKASLNGREEPPITTPVHVRRASRRISLAESGVLQENSSPVVTPRNNSDSQTKPARSSLKRKVYHDSADLNQDASAGQIYFSPEFVSTVERKSKRAKKTRSDSPTAQPEVSVEQKALDIENLPIDLTTSPDQKSTPSTSSNNSFIMQSLKKLRRKSSMTPEDRMKVAKRKRSARKVLVPSLADLLSLDSQKSPNKPPSSPALGPKSHRNSKTPSPIKILSPIALNIADKTASNLKDKRLKRRRHRELAVVTSAEE